MPLCGGLVPSYFKSMIQEANKHSSTIKIDQEEIPVYRIKTTVWGKERTCIISVSAQLKEGQLRGIHQHLKKKYDILNELKRSLKGQSQELNYHERSSRGGLLKLYTVNLLKRF